MATPPVAKTKIIRTPATGPEPANQLVFLRCRVPGADVGVAVDDQLVQWESHFLTEFRLDGYTQANFDWYVENTLVSATASLKLMNTTTDLTFLLGIDTVEPELEQRDGTLGFRCRLAAKFQNDAIFASREEIALVATLTAYVLCWEPRAAVPPGGRQRTPWATRVSDGIRYTDAIRPTRARRGTAELGGC